MELELAVDPQLPPKRDLDVSSPLDSESKRVRLSNKLDLEY
jgi:hypothetical protein